MTMSFSDIPSQPSTPVQVIGRSNTRQTGESAYRRFAKPALDATLVVLAAPVVVPVVAALAVAVARDGASPFYSQIRVGKNGREFRMWKLRSMVRNADAQLAELLARDPAAKAEWDSTQKLRHDPRVTRFGRILRCTSLDELPQLWNVLKGEMSLVGPRPMMVDQKALYPGKAYYRLRPGITGMWQTMGRNQTTFEARADFDDAYENAVSAKTDISLILRTLKVVVARTGC